MPSTVTKQSSISPVGGVSATGQMGGSGLINSSSNGLHKSSMIYDTSVNKTTVTGGGNNGKKGIFLHNIQKPNGN